MQYHIAMVCDFFYPQLGGVEFHIFHLAQNLLKLGHSVLVITHAYDDRVGVRYLASGLKVYHVPYLVLHRGTTFPTLYCSFPILRNIFIREQIQIVHSHGTASTLALEAIFHANTMGLRTVFTDHSLYGFANIGAILLNKLLKFSLTNIDRTICVSNICKDNMIVRTDIAPEKISVIPNAVVSQDFKPMEKKNSLKGNKDPNKSITLVVISRLYPNKGIDLLIRLVPKICSIQKNVRFIIAGDGPKYVELQQMIESQRLQDRVNLMGAVPHEKVREIMCQGDIYLHPSLTEAFGTVLIEAASCGLLIVSTTVGGIPEVLPEHMIVYASETSVSSLVAATNEGIRQLRGGEIDTSLFHQEVSKMYNWMNVAERTAAVYDDIYKDASANDKNWLVMVKRFYSRDGIWAKHLYVLSAIGEYILYIVLEWLFPRSDIDLAPKWPYKEYASGTRF
ncbi:SPT14 (YPL175W) [Zygosaccharomyces parabailii]|nr:SPT14 (YPL175W) [Zygosaccharomyces parabailii]